MIITKISDGLGNQLFMYACGYALSKRLNTKLKLDISYLDTSPLRTYELNKLNICFDILFTVDPCRYYLLKVFCRKIMHAWMKCRYSLFKEKYEYKFDSDILNIKDNTYLNGYWQSEKYFKSYRNDLLKMFTPKYELSDGCKNYIHWVHNNNSVAIHVRRGDYVALGICIGNEYYDKAITYIEKKIESPVYYVFSDDLYYAKDMFKDKQGIYNYVKYESSNLGLDDFFIMKECDHIIMANSSFSWWAAWLNNNDDKIVVCPKYEQREGDFYPEEWKQID